MTRNSSTSSFKALEANQVADWVEQLDLENQALRECISRCADTLINRDLANEDRDSASSRRKGLAVLLEASDVHAATHMPSPAHLRAKQLLQSRVLKSGTNANFFEHGQVSLDLELDRSSVLMEEQLRHERTRFTSLDVEVDALQRDLTATQERQQTLENAELEERLRHDALRLGSCFCIFVALVMKICFCRMLPVERVVIK